MAGVGRRKSSPAAIAVDKRQIKAVNLRLSGTGFEDIAEELGYSSASGAYHAVMSAMKKSLREPTEELRELELGRLDALQASTWEGALSGDIDSINASLRIMERRARLLGLERKDGPIRVKIPKLESVKDAVAVVSALIERVAEGGISPEDAGRVAGLVGIFAKTAETSELAEKLAKLEEMALTGAEREGTK